MIVTEIIKPLDAVPKAIKLKMVMRPPKPGELELDRYYVVWFQGCCPDCVITMILRRTTDYKNRGCWWSSLHNNYLEEAEPLMAHKVVGFCPVPIDIEEESEE